MNGVIIGMHWIAWLYVTLTSFSLCVNRDIPTQWKAHNGVVLSLQLSLTPSSIWTSLFCNMAQLILIWEWGHATASTSWASHLCPFLNPLHRTFSYKILSLCQLAHGIPEGCIQSVKIWPYFDDWNLARNFDTVAS